VSTAEHADLVVGAGTHLDTHTAAACDPRGRAVSQLQVPATTAGYGQLLDWARAIAGGGQIAWAIEGTRHYGLGLARYLASAGQQVAETGSTRHVGKRRAGKSDPIDAVRAARELLARPHPAQMRADGDREALRLLMIDRDHAVASCKSARTALAAVLVTAPAPLREQLRHLPRERRARACAALDCPPGADRQTRVLHQTLARLGQRIADLAGTAAGIEAQITQIAGDMTPGLVAAEPGLGALSAAQILLSWSHAGRIRSEAAFAMLPAPPRSPSPPAAPTATASTASATASSTGH
jgi:transposase